MTRPPAAPLTFMTNGPFAVGLGAGVAAAAFGSTRGGLAAGFGEGTLLATPDGPVPVERLRPGDRLSAPDGGSQRLRARNSRVAASGGVLLPAECLGPNLPRRPLIVHPRQPLLWAGQPLAALGLVCGGAVRRCPAASMLHGLALERPGSVLAEGLAFALRPPLRPEHDVRVGAALAAARRLQGLRAGHGELLGDVVLDDTCTLRGWALDTAMPEAPVLLQVLLDDVTIGFTLADEARPDLAMLGLGTGACGFALALEAGALEAGALEAGALETRALEAGALEAGALEAGAHLAAPGLLRIHAVASGAALPGAPLLLDTARQPMPPAKTGDDASVRELAELLGRLEWRNC